MCFRINSSDNKSIKVKVLGCLILFCFTFACVKKKKGYDDVLKGHWHTSRPQVGLFKTLDIEDSMAWVDKYDLISIHTGVESNDPITGDPILPSSDGIPYTSQFRMHGESLTIGSSNYFRSNPDTCEIHDRYLSLKININPGSDSVHGFDYDQLSASYVVANLFVGSHKRSYFQSFDLDEIEKMTLEFPDSILIKAHGAFINLNQIPRYCENLKQMSESTTLVFHIDKEVSDEFIRKIINAIPDGYNHLKAVKMPDGSLGVTWRFFN